jgi:hypothetical protein
MTHAVGVFDEDGVIASKSLAKNLRDFSSSLSVAIGKVIGGSDRTDVPQRIDGIFTLSLGRCQSDANSLMLTIWPLVTFRASAEEISLFLAKSDGPLAVKELPSERVKTP